MPETHTKPIRASKKPIRKPKAGNVKLQQRITGNRCGTTASGAKTKQETTRKNSLGRIGKDEVTSSNLVSSSTKTA